MIYLTPLAFQLGPELERRLRASSLKLLVLNAILNWLCYVTMWKSLKAVWVGQPLLSTHCLLGRSETYQYYDLAFCRPPDGLKHKPETLGEVSLTIACDGQCGH